MSDYQPNNNQRKSQIPWGIFYGAILGFVMQNIIAGIAIGVIAAFVLDSKAREKDNKKDSK